MYVMTNWFSYSQAFKSVFNGDDDTLGIYCPYILAQSTLLPFTLFVSDALRPGDAYMHQLTGSSLIQMIGYCLFGTKLFGSVLICCQLDHQVKTESKRHYFHTRNWVSNVVSEVAHICLSLKVLTGKPYISNNGNGSADLLPSSSIEYIQIINKNIDARKI